MKSDVDRLFRKLNAVPDHFYRDLRPKNAGTLIDGAAAEVRGRNASNSAQPVSSPVAETPADEAPTTEAGETIREPTSSPAAAHSTAVDAVGTDDPAIVGAVADANQGRKVPQIAVVKATQLREAPKSLSRWPSSSVIGLYGQETAEARLRVEHVDPADDDPGHPAMPERHSRGREKLDLLRRLRRDPTSFLGGRGSHCAARVFVYSPLGGAGVSVVSAGVARALSIDTGCCLVDTDGSAVTAIRCTTEGERCTEEAEFAEFLFNGVWRIGQVRTLFLRHSMTERWLPVLLNREGPSAKVVPAGLVDDRQVVVDWPRSRWRELFEWLPHSHLLVVTLRPDLSALVAAERMRKMLISHDGFSQAGRHVVFVINRFVAGDEVHEEILAHLTERLAGYADIQTVPEVADFDLRLAAGDDVIASAALDDVFRRIVATLPTGHINRLSTTS